MKNGAIWKAGLVVLVAGVVWYLARPRGSAPVAPTASPPAPSAMPPAPAPVAPPGKPALSAPQAKVGLLREILASRNDNDPRLDSEFRNLDAATKKALIDYYGTLPVANANARGTVVFLLGREIRSTADLKFFNRVLSEKVREVPDDPEFPSRLLAAYPQLHAVRALGKVLATTDDGALRAGVRGELERAAKSPNTEVAAHARRALEGAK